MSLSLEELLLFNQGEQSAQFVASRDLEVWIKLDDKNRELLYPEEGKPGRNELMVMSGISQGENSILLRSRFPFTLYRKDVIKFESGKIIIVKETIKFDGYFSDNLVSIFDAKEDIELGEQSNVYGMMPLLSAKEGGYPQITATYAEAHNKNQGLHPISQKIKETGTATITGDINHNDYSLGLLSLIQKGIVTKLFVQIRHELNTIIDSGSYGTGFGAIEFWAIPFCGLVDSESGFTNFSLQLELLGKIDEYKLITGPFGTRYCPFDAINTNIYHISFEVIPSQDYTNYCPLDSTGFYDF